MTDSTRDIHPITDSHCHLDFPDFDGELPDVIARAQAAGVTRMVSICTKLKNEPAVRAIAEAHAPVFYAAGTHPMSVATEPMAWIDGLDIPFSQPACAPISPRPVTAACP